MNVLSLFSGIGGLELGLERAGMTVVGQVEIDAWCRQVLEQHWPEVPRHDDVRTAPGWWASCPRPRVGLVAGGFPCQPFSNAGFQLGIDDERWGWPWFADVVRLVRPRYVVVENVSALLRDGAAWGCVLADLAALGFDASWDCVPAAAVGAPHLRDRVFLIANATSSGESNEQTCSDGKPLAGSAVPRASARADGRRLTTRTEEPGRGASLVATFVADPDRVRRDRRTRERRPSGWPEPTHSSWWAAEPDVARVAHGVPGGVDRRKALGNAVVPQVAEHIGRLVMAGAS